MAPKPFKYSYRLTVLGLAIVLVCAGAALSLGARAAETPVSHGGRIFVLMVWDGLRPDLVNSGDTPNLFALSSNGTRFARHHAVFPTVTMVNAAALATGAMPAINGLLGNVIYFPPFLPKAHAAPFPAEVRRAVARPVFIEDTKLLLALNSPAGLNGQLLTAESIGQEVQREGGYLAVLGKKGPTFLFDDSIGAAEHAKDGFGPPHRDYLFVSSDVIQPDSAARDLAPRMPSAGDDGIALDAFMTSVAISRGLPRAKAVAEAGHMALVVLWQRNPDASQHRYGLGTAQALKALAADDANLGSVRKAISALGIQRITDLMVVSDHGFATIASNVNLARSLVQIGVKQSLNSDDVVVAPNGGMDEIILSSTKFPTEIKRLELLQRIVNFAAVQEWCGPIFSRSMSSETSQSSGIEAEEGGWVDGTFSFAQMGLDNPDRSPDLIISFKELPGLDNSPFTGPENPGSTLDAHGRHAAWNTSAKLIRPVQGIVFNDFGPYPFGTGLGMHGAAGLRELHNFAAADGPDFRRGFVDQLPTGNIDIAPTIAAVLGLKFPSVGNAAGPRGRVIHEALAGDKSAPPSSRSYEVGTRLIVGKTAVTSVIHISTAGSENYLDASEVMRGRARARSKH